MAFTAKILSWRFRHLNIVGCLLKRRPTEGGSQAPQETPLAMPLERVRALKEIFLVVDKTAYFHYF